MYRAQAPTGVVVVFAFLAVLAGCGSSSSEASDRGCGRAVLGDWSDGSIDGTYPERCYLAAIDGLPEDLRAYTSAREDISRALVARQRAAEAAGRDARTLAEASPGQVAEVSVADRPPRAVLLLAGLVGAVCAAGGGAFVARRLRRRRT